MSAPSFTPGPWVVRRRNGPGNIKAEVCYGADDECITDGVYEIEDARLIAAAPELLEALKRMVSTYGPGETCKEYTDASAAIAKAEGREP